MRRSSRIAGKPTKNYRSDSDDLEQEVDNHYALMENPNANLKMNVIRPRYPRYNLCTARVMVALATFITVVLILMFPLNVDASVDQNPLHTLRMHTHMKPKVKFTKIEV